MVTFLASIHIIACLGLIGLVMIQDSKGGGVFTSQATSNSVLGAGGATSLAKTMTKVIAVLFAATCIGLSIMSAKSEKSVIDTMAPGAAVPAAAAIPVESKAVPAAPPAAPAPASNEKK